MTTWGEVQAHVREHYELLSDNPHSFSLWFEYETGRRQQITVRRFAAFDIDWVEFRSAVCPRSKLDPEQAVRRNETLACGALALDESDTYVLLYTAPLPTLDREELDMPLYVIAGTADHLEHELTGDDLS